MSPQGVHEVPDGMTGSSPRKQIVVSGKPAIYQEPIGLVHYAKPCLCRIVLNPYNHPMRCVVVIIVVNPHLIYQESEIEGKELVRAHGVSKW